MCVFVMFTYSCLNACGKFGQSSITISDSSFQAKDKATAGGMYNIHTHYIHT